MSIPEKKPPTINLPIWEPIAIPLPSTQREVPSRRYVDTSQPPRRRYVESPQPRTHDEMVDFFMGRKQERKK
jgi:hypothetical protein